MKQKRGEVAVSTLIIIIASLILLSGFLYGYFNKVDSFTSESYSNTKFAKNSLTQGLAVVEVDGLGGQSGAITSFSIIVRLLPDSNEIDFNKANILVNTFNWSSSLVYRSGSPVQNDSGYVSYANGTGYFQVESMIDSSFHKVDSILRGETAKLFVHVPYPISFDKIVGFKLISPSGVSYPVTVYSGDTIPSNDHILLYPKI